MVKSIEKALGNGFDLSTSPPAASCSATLLGSGVDVKILSKENYERILFNKRMEYVMQYFAPEMKKVFDDLRVKAESMKICNVEVQFTVPENLDIDYTENLLCLLFTDLGYKPLIEARKEMDTLKRKVTLTLV